MTGTGGRVIVAGAGPVGLCLALHLARREVPVCLLETLPADRFLDQPRRAGTLHPATLEILDDLGLYPRLEKRGLIAPIVQFWDRARNEMFAQFDHAALKQDTRFPYVLQCDRLKVVDEAMQAVHAHDCCEVRMGATLVDFEQRADGVDVTVANEAGGKERLHGSFLVSCEGAHSVVRKSLGIEFEGYTYPERTLVVSVVHDFDRLHGYSYRNYLSDPEEWANLFKWGHPELWRVVLPTRMEEDPAALLTDDSIEQRLQRMARSGRRYEVVQRGLYTVHQRVAKTFRAGRAILAGDAAHVNSPIGAMGMNSGIHDAANLGEKLVAILRDDAGLELLDRYTRQRRHVAVNHTRAQTERNQRLLAEKDPAVRQRNHDALRRMAGDPALAREYLLRASMIAGAREAAGID